MSKKPNVNSRWPSRIILPIQFFCGDNQFPWKMGNNNSRSPGRSGETRGWRLWSWWRHDQYQKSTMENHDGPNRTNKQRDLVGPGEQQQQHWQEAVDLRLRWPDLGSRWLDLDVQGATGDEIGRIWWATGRRRRIWIGRRLVWADLDGRCSWRWRRRPVAMKGGDRSQWRRRPREVAVMKTGRNEDSAGGGRSLRWR